MLKLGFRGSAALALFLIIGLVFSQTAQGQPGEWRSINPVVTDLNDVWIVSSSSGWAVGDSGRSAYWNGIQWKEILTPFSGTVAVTLNGVSCLSTTRCVAAGTTSVGPDAVLLQWDGTAWVDRSALVPAGTTGLNEVYVRASDGLTFAVGTGAPNIIRIPDANVVPLTVAAEASVAGTLNSVWMLSPDPGGSLRAFTVGSAGVSYRWDGLGWPAELTGVATDLLSVSMISTSDAFAVGTVDTIIRWNGASWTGPMVAPTAGETYEAVHMLSSVDGWIVGTVGAVQSTYIRWNGLAWTLLTTDVPTAVDLNGVYMRTSSEGWAVGAGGTIAKWDGSRWNSQTQPVLEDLNGVWLASSTDGWTVGDSGRIIRYNGVYWNLYQTLPSTADLLDVHGSASNNVWAVGEDTDGAGAADSPTIEKWNGASWTEITAGLPTATTELRAVFASSPTFIMAGGAGIGAGLMVKSTDGISFGSILTGMPAADFVNGIWMLGTTDGWAVGTTGSISRYNVGGTGDWSAETSPVATELFDVQALSSTNVWAVGASGVILHRDATGWSVVPSGTAVALNSIYMVSATEGWVVGALDAGEAIILFWNGFTWSRVFGQPMGGVIDPLNAVWMVSSTDGWAVGSILDFGAVTGATVTTVPVTVTGTSTVFVTSSSVIATSSLTTSTTQTLTSTSYLATTTVPTQTTTTSTVTAQATSTQFVATATGTTTATATVTSTFTGQVPPIPGFPLESILAGLVAGLGALFVLHRRRSSG